jgi:hypothetical protein
MDPIINPMQTRCRSREGQTIMIEPGPIPIPGPWFPIKC